jgi:hypothetical protein
MGSDVGRLMEGRRLLRLGTAAARAAFRAGVGLWFNGRLADDVDFGLGVEPFHFDFTKETTPGFGGVHNSWPYARD